jgi:hypothetical protein
VRAVEITREGDIAIADQLAEMLSRIGLNILNARCCTGLACSRVAGILEYAVRRAQLAAQSMHPNLSPEDYATIAALLRDTIAADRFPLSPRVRRWKAILDKLEPPAPKRKRCRL